MADACEAFLQGRYRDLHADDDEQRPWVLMNRVAHGSFDDLAKFVVRHHQRTDPEAVAGVKAGAEADVSLVRLLLRVAPTPEELRRVQHEVLWPLEALLEDMAAEGHPPRPAELRCMVASALLRPPSPI